MNVTEFFSTAVFLRTFIRALPKRGHGELSRIAKHLRISTTLVSQVLAGEKHFTTEQAEALASYLGLVKLDADYFIYLNQFERAGTEGLKKFWEAKLTELRQRSKIFVERVETDLTLNDKQKTIYYSNPIYACIRVFCSLGNKGKTLEEIATRFSLSRSKASELVDFLVDTQICKKTDNHYFVGAQKIHLETGSPYLPRHHTNWRLSAVQQLHKNTEEDHFYTGLVSLSEKDFMQLRKNMNDFIKECLNTVHESNPETMACMNLDFFKI